METFEEKIQNKVNNIPNLSITNLNENEIHLLSKSAFINADTMTKIQTELGLIDLGVSWCPCEGYNPHGIILIGYFK